MNGVFKCAREDDERRPGSVKRSSLGMPHAPPINIQETQASKLGYATVHPLLHQQLLVRPSFHYIFNTSCVMCYAWSVLIFTFLFSLALIVVHNELEPKFLCVGEKHAPL